MKIMLKEQRTLDGLTYTPGSHEVTDDVAMRLLANFPRVAAPETFRAVAEDLIVQKGIMDDDIGATQSAFRLAREYDIDLRTVIGSGKDGRILKSDVQAAIDE